MTTPRVCSLVDTLRPLHVNMMTTSEKPHLFLRVRVHPPLAAWERCDVDESSVVQHALLRTTLRLLLLLLLLNLWCLLLDLASTGEGAVHFSHVVLKVGTSRTSVLVR